MRRIKEEFWQSRRVQTSRAADSAFCNFKNTLQYSAVSIVFLSHSVVLFMEVVYIRPWSIFALPKQTPTATPKPKTDDPRISRYRQCKDS